MEYFSSGWYVALALLGFGFVIFIHELGHFLFAKWAGVKVERFSIGFGPILFRWSGGETEYALSLLPLGGYVKMLGQEDLPASIPESIRKDPRSYLAASRWWQTGILLAGVLFNLVSSYVILLLLAWHGLPIVEPVVGELISTGAETSGIPEPGPAFRAGLHQGDRILAINGTPIRTFEDLSLAVVTSGRTPLTFTVERAGVPAPLTLPADGQGVVAEYDRRRGLPSLGIERPKGRCLEEVLVLKGAERPDDPQRGERLVAINGETLPENLVGQQIEDRLLPFLGREVALTLERDDRMRAVKVRYAGDGTADDLALALPVRVRHVEPGEAGAVAGIMPGDVLLSVDDQAVSGASHFLSLVREPLDQARPFTVTVLRGEERIACTVLGQEIGGRRRMGVALTRIASGRLPVLPAAWDGGDSPLVQAGLVPGDAILAMTPATADPPGGGPRPVEVVAVAGGESLTIPLGEADLTAIQRPRRAPLLLRLFGAAGVPSLIEQLAGNRVESTGDGAGFPGPGFMRVGDRHGAHRTVNLAALSPELRAALLTTLKAGDWITGLTVAQGGGRAVEAVRGAGAPRTLKVVPRDPGVAFALAGQEMKPYRLRHWTEAFSIANGAAYDMVVTTLTLIPRFFRPPEEGGIDANKSLAGPIGIFRMLKGSAEILGFSSFLRLLALIGLNLFLINLLPIPITDGGQLLFLGIETAIRRPLPNWVRNAAMWAGVIIVVALMLYVIGLDVLRLMGAL